MNATRLRPAFVAGGIGGFFQSPSPGSGVKYENGITRAVFLSSFSSFDGCKSFYGKAKYLIEAEALKLSYAVVRPGLVWGLDTGGTMGSLEKAVRASRFVLLIGDGLYAQYPVFDEDLARLVFELCQPNAPSPAKPIAAAVTEKFPLRELILDVARKNGRRVTLIPIPWRLLFWTLKTMEALRLPTPFRSDSVIGIVFQNPSPDFSTLAQFDVKFRPFA